MSNPTFRCFRCGIDVTRPNAACTDCHTTDPAYCKTPPPTTRKKQAKTKLNEDDVAHIRELLAKGTSCAAIARQYGVVRQSIGDIKTGTTWTQVKATV